ncbi:MAG: TonB-dependent receptor [Gemmatimonadales bacterium]
MRGASSFTARGLKTYIDGVEVASPTLVSLIDPRSIERIEVIRGLRARGPYGSDAINGVIQVVTRKGTLGESPKVQGSAAIAAGPFDREEISTLLRQDYAGGMSWGGSRASIAAGGSLGRVGNAESTPNTRSWNAQAGAQIAMGSFLLSGIARGGQFNFTEDAYRAVAISTAPAASTAATVDVATVGVTAIHQVRDWWVQTLVAGYDQAQGALGSQRDYLTTAREPLGATHENARKSSLRYSSAFTTNWGQGLVLTTTAGAEYSHLERSRGSWNASLAGRYVRLYDDVVNNTGTFVQGKLKAGAFVVNAGARAEWSSAFGESYGTAWAPSVGVAWNRPISGDLALRLRGGWGRGIRPPEPGMSRGMATATIQQIVNTNLAPESQSGLEVGADLYAGTTGYLRATVFDQRASDLIQSVLQPGQAGSLRSFQFQNVGAIRNRGVELEGGLRFRNVGIDGQFYSTTSKIERIARNYSGWLRPGDRLPEIPSYSGAARVSYTLPGLQFAAGASFLGSWTGYDWTEIAEVDAGLKPAKASVRDYLITYPGVFKPYFSVSVVVARQFTPYLVIDNLANRSEYEQHNGNPPAGRSVMFGVEVRP